MHGFLYSGGSYTTLDVGTESPYVTGINNAGQIVGDYAGSSGGLHGFLATPPTATTYTFSTLNAPSGTGGTQAFGINDAGQIVGDYADSSGTEHGFLYSGGNFTYSTLDDPSATNGTAASWHQRLWARSSGSTLTAAARSTASLYSGGHLHSRSTIRRAPMAPRPIGINDAGQIVGFYYDSSVTAHGFLYSGGNYTTLDDPSGTKGTIARGINDAGQIVGYYFDSSGTTHGFLYSGGTYTTLDDPLGTEGTLAYGINDAGQIVGDYTDSSGTEHGFLYSGGTYTTLDDPLGTKGTIARGINDAGQIVGVYIDSSGAEHGFLANPSSATTTPPTSVQQEVLGLYAALYNRAADFPGYSFWVGIDGQQSDSGGVTVANAGTTAVTLNDARRAGTSLCQYAGYVLQSNLCQPDR